jgi:hypothetical protein
MTTSAIRKILSGLVDMHCHSGPSPFPRRFDHAEAARDGHDGLQMRAMVAKSHHHSTVMDILAMKDRLAHIPTQVFGGIALNNQVGGLNRFAVEMALKLGGKVVWFPTFSSGRHIECHPENLGFPTATVSLSTERIDVTDGNGEPVPAVHGVLDVIAEAGAVLNGGHMYPDDIRAVFALAKEKGIKRMAVSHPDFVIGAEPETCRELVRMGAFIEHEMHMYHPEPSMKWDVKQLYRWIDEIGPEHTVLASDLGQATLPTPVEAFLYVAEALLDLGLPERDLQLMVRNNPSYLLGLDD